MNWEEKLSDLPAPLTQIMNRSNNAICFRIHRIAAYKREVEALSPFWISTLLRQALKMYSLSSKEMSWMINRIFTASFFCYGLALLPWACFIQYRQNYLGQSTSWATRKKNKLNHWTAILDWTGNRQLMPETLCIPVKLYGSLHWAICQHKTCLISCQ